MNILLSITIFRLEQQIVKVPEKGFLKGINAKEQLLLHVEGMKE